MGQNATTQIPRAPELPRPGAGAVRVLLWIIGLGIIYAYGWQVTQINLGELTRKAYLVAPLLGELIRPDLLERKVHGRSKDRGSP